MRSVVVPVKTAVDACARFLDDQRVLVEPACGAALVPVYEELQEISDFNSLLVIVCGGATTTTSKLNNWMATL